MRFVKGDIFTAQVEAIVNPVNTVGVMGAGLALQFKKRFPANYLAYQEACRKGELQIGRVHVFRIDGPGRLRYIFNLPTKKHWRDPSRLEYIQAGLDALTREIVFLGVTSIAVPALGTGLGGLPWSNVRPLLEEAFKRLPDVEVWVYEP